MGDCIHCGRPVGLMRKQHKECKTKYKIGMTELIEFIVRAAENRLSVDQLQSQIDVYKKSYHIKHEQIRQLLISGWGRAVENAFEHGVLSRDEEDGLVALKERFMLSQDDLDNNGQYTQVVKGAVLRDLIEGKTPERVSYGESLPFNFQKTEKIIWIFPETAYYEQKTRRQYVGGSKGMSVRVAKGVYLRASAFKGHPVEHTEIIHAGNGILAVTNKHIYWGCRRC